MQNTHLNPLPYRQHTLSVHYEPLENFHHTTSRQDYTAPPKSHNYWHIWQKKKCCTNKPTIQLFKFMFQFHIFIV